MFSILEPIEHVWRHITAAQMTNEELIEELEGEAGCAEMLVYDHEHKRHHEAMDALREEILKRMEAK